MPLNMHAAADRQPPWVSSIDRVAAALFAASFLLLYWPTALTLNRVVWSHVEQSYGPIFLAASAWLFWQRRDQLMSIPANAALGTGFATLAVALLLYALGRSQSIIMFETGSMIVFLIAVLLLTKGWRAVRVSVLPLVILLFVVPLPGEFVAAVTAPLKAAVSSVAASLLAWAGYPVGRTGVILMVGPYQMLVADACAGLTSMFTLEAIGLVYMGLRPSPSRMHDITLGVLLVPIAFAANVIRVLILVLVTYHLGDEAGQGFIHGAAGIVLFAIATLFMLVADKLLGYMPALRHGRAWA